MGLAWHLRRLTSLASFIGRGRYCACCTHTSRRFLPGGRTLIRDASRCGWCGSLERHRGAAMMYPELGFQGADVLHMAPEGPLTKVIQRLGPNSYRTGDLEPGRADDVADLTDLPYADQSFDRIVCNHVLEHIPDDAAALAEMRRVLRPGGMAVLMFPVSTEATTDEDPAVTDPETRLARWGHPHHVRRYGQDVVKRLGRFFDVQVRDPHRELDATYHGLRTRDDLYLCRVPT
ncbi:MAG: class I SAM-dependent methyltransferase [Thermoplasmatota archaeon]